jgi:hypothetical protein
MTDEPELDFTRTHARRNDPVTSHEAAKLAAVRAGSTKHQILKALTGVFEPPLTFEAVAYYAKISEGSAWKRLSDLKREGRVTVVDENGTTRAGARCSRYMITELGRESIDG